MSMLFVGADPDLDTSAIAAVDNDGNVRFVGVICNETKATGRQAVIDATAAISKSLPDIADFLLSDERIGGIHLCVESQEIYAGKTKNPRSILWLGQVAGALLLGLRALFEDRLGPCLFPPPQEWKGSIPKEAHQGRILKKLGWEWEVRGSKRRSQKARTKPLLQKHSSTGYCVPKLTDAIKAIPGASDLKESDWKHVVDAIGLAVWARDQWNQSQAIAEALASRKRSSK